MLLPDLKAKILNYIYSAKTENHVFISPKFECDRFDTTEEMFRAYLKGFEEYKYITMEPASGGRVRITRAAKGFEVYNVLKPKTELYRAVVLMYIFENLEYGGMSFDGEFASRILNIPVQYVMEIMENYEEAEYFHRIPYAGYKSRITYQLSGREAYQKLLDMIQSNRSQNESIDAPNIDIFISHSARDEEIVNAVTRLITRALKIDDTRIRVTTISGYKLPTGGNTNEILRSEIVSTNAFIAIITENSMSSPYVLFELGARWGTDKNLLPLVCHSKEVELLKGPLGMFNAKFATREGDIQDFLLDIGRILDIPVVSSNLYRHEEKILIQMISSAPKPLKVNTNISDQDVTLFDWNTLQSARINLSKLYKGQTLNKQLEAAENFYRISSWDYVPQKDLEEIKQLALELHSKDFIHALEYVYNRVDRYLPY